MHPLQAPGLLPGPLHVAALQTALWSTLQADLLYVLTLPLPYPHPYPYPYP